MCTLTLADFSNFISIATPIVLFLWFLVSRKSHLQEIYYKEVTGNYGGITAPITEIDGKVRSGFLLHIFDVDANGYFMGEFNFGENKFTYSYDGGFAYQQLQEGNYPCLGRIDHEINTTMDRHPMRADENRTYRGKFYVVDRLDFEFKSSNFEQYIKLEYDLVHYREMKVIELTLVKSYKDAPQLPSIITIHKKIGLQNDVYDIVKLLAFKGQHK